MWVVSRWAVGVWLGGRGRGSGSGKPEYLKSAARSVFDICLKQTTPTTTGSHSKRPSIVYSQIRKRFRFAI